MQPAERIRKVLTDHTAAVEGALLQHEASLIAVAGRMADCLQQGKSILSCGNGGSACDAMHFAGELVGRFVSDRVPLPAMALSTDPGILTAIGNDYGFDQVFARQVHAHAAGAGMLVAISTSGASANVLRALDAAGERGLWRVLLTGQKGEGVTQAETVIAVPSLITAHIQEAHITILQLLIALVEDKLFK